MVCTIASGTSAEYYIEEQAEYYTDGKEPSGEWYSPNGEFGLSDKSKVQARSFLNLHSGNNIKGEPIVKAGSGLNGRVTAHDMTFSAPKSVSTLWAVGDEKTRHTISNAQNKAVRDALDMLNHNAAFARRGKGGATLEKVTLTAALFEHGEARPTDSKSIDLMSDPQLHTHSVIMNMAKRSDGTIGALDARHLYKWKMAAGATYRSSLAYELRKELGAQIEVTDKSGLFEVVGVPEKVRNNFSSRRSEILSSLDKLGLSSKEAPKTAAKITKFSRNSKLAGFESREGQFNRWSNEAETLGFAEKEVQSCLGYDHKPINEQTAKAETHKAIQSLTEFDSVFEERHIVAKVAATATEMGAPPEFIQHTMDELRASEAVLQAGLDPLGLPVYSTPEQIKLEQDLQVLAVNSQSKSCHKLSEKQVSRFIKSTNLSGEQKDAVMALTTKTDLAVLEGAAGAGKSHTLKHLAELYKDNGYSVIGSATAWKTANQLGADCGIKSKATDAWLASLQNGKPFLDNKSVLIVDEAGLLSSRQMHQILSAAKTAKAKVILAGDREQLQAIGAGPGLRIVADKVKVARLDTILRMKEQWARNAANNFAKGNASVGLKAYIEHGLFHMFEDPEKLHQTLISDWLNHKIEKPNETSLVIAHTNNEMKALNLQMRASLQDMGLLSNEETIISTTNKSGKIEALPLANGEHIRFGIKHDTLGLVNGSIGQIEDIKLMSGDAHLSVNVNDRMLQFKLSDIANEKGQVRLQHAYASTLYSAQGMTVDRAFISASHVFKRNDIYVATSRARGLTSLYANKSTIGRNLLDTTPLNSRKGHLMSTDDITNHLSSLWSTAQNKVSTLDYLPTGFVSKVISSIAVKSKSILPDVSMGR